MRFILEREDWLFISLNQFCYIGVGYIPTKINIEEGCSIDIEMLALNTGETKRQNFYLIQIETK